MCLCSSLSSESESEFQLWMFLNFPGASIKLRIVILQPDSAVNKPEMSFYSLSPALFDCAHFLCLYTENSVVVVIQTFPLFSSTIGAKQQTCKLIKKVQYVHILSFFLWNHVEMLEIDDVGVGSGWRELIYFCVWDVNIEFRTGMSCLCFTWI